ncbi:DUF4013 domain-containing protein [candidate division CSSED10-310 bacterium]|uniref:DUF4013 domain-containing protein n=1 Tax=candidate division CSSED10-310 bacterium TaxID=2855610 RepID=A0ABV6YX35_UNCC1
MPSLKEAMQFPFTDKYWARRLLIGGILLPIPIIGFFPMGYLMRHFLAYLKGHKVDKLPEWDDLPAILSYGFFGTIILLGYLLVPFLILALGIKVWGSFWGVLFVFLSFIIGVWLMSYFPMGLAAYLVSGKLGNAFQKNVLYKNISQISTSYYHSFLIAILLLFLAGNSPFVLFFLLLVFGEMFGKTISPVFTPPETEVEATEEKEEEAPAAEEE